jgi:hypothetical protein
MKNDWENLLPLPPDDPIFSGQVSFVFRSELPPGEDPVTGYDPEGVEFIKAQPLTSSSEDGYAASTFSGPTGRTCL